MSEGSGLSPGVLSSVSDKEKSGRVQSCESYSVSGVFKPPLTDPRERFFRSFFQRLKGTAPRSRPAPEPASRSPPRWCSPGRKPRLDAPRKPAAGPVRRGAQIRPGSSANCPATTMAPANIEIMARQRSRPLCPCARPTAGGSMTSMEIDNRSIDLPAPLGRVAGAHP